MNLDEFQHSTRRISTNLAESRRISANLGESRRNLDKFRRLCKSRRKSRPGLSVSSREASITPVQRTFSCVPFGVRLPVWGKNELHPDPAGLGRLYCSVPPDGAVVRNARSALTGDELRDRGVVKWPVSEAQGISANLRNSNGISTNLGESR